MGCWIWTGSKVRGYGQFKLPAAATGSAPKMVKAHRFSFELARGPIPDGAFLCHKCDVRACVNPDHMFVGTPADNMRDKVEKGRLVTCPGERNGMAKLNREDVARIREMLAAGIFQRTIAAQFGVNQQTISKIKLGRRWHLD